VSRRNWPVITAAFAIGVGVGAIVGMMLAPQSGEETRAYLRERAEDGIDEVKAQGKRVARRAQATLEDAKDFMNEAMDRGKAAYREARS